MWIHHTNIVDIVYNVNLECRYHLCRLNFPLCHGTDIVDHYKILFHCSRVFISRLLRILYCILRTSFCPLSFVLKTTDQKAKRNKKCRFNQSFIFSACQVMLCEDRRGGLWQNTRKQCRNNMHKKYNQLEKLEAARSAYLWLSLVTFGYL